MSVALVGTIGAVQLGAANTSTPGVWGTSENRTANHLLVAWVDIHGTATLPTTPGGWTIAVQEAGTSCSTTIYYRMATGADAVPSIAAMGASTYIQIRLGEFSGVAYHTTTPPDRGGVAAGTGATLTATTGGVDASVGDLVCVAGVSFYSAAATKTISHTVTGGTTTITSTNNNSTSLARHYNFGYGPCTSIAGAESDSYAQTTTAITGGAVVIASFKLGGSAGGVLATGTGAGIVAGKSESPGGVLASGTGAAFNAAGQASINANAVLATATGAAFNATVAKPSTTGAYSGVGGGVFQRRDNAAILAGLNARQVERRKELDAAYAVASARNAAILRARQEAHRQREEEWLLGLLTDAEFIAS